MKKSLLSILICACILLSACSGMSYFRRIEEMGELLDSIEDGHLPSIPSASKPNTQEPTEEGPQGSEKPNKPEKDRNPLRNYVPYEEYERPYEPFREEVPFSQLPYERPDAEAIREAYGAIQTMVEAEGSVEEIVEAYEKAFEEHTYFDTMNSLAYIRYSLNLKDSYYDTEYNWCEEQSPLLYQAQEKCHVAMAESSLRKALEEAYFEEGFFEFYDENRIYSKDRVVELMQQETDIQSQYMALQDETTITWEEKERSVDELLNDPELPYDDYLQVYRSYYNKYTPKCAELFAELIRVRKEIAKELEYDSYADFAYSYTYERDYSPEQVQDYCNAIGDEMVSLLFTAAMAQGNAASKPLEESLRLFEGTVEEFGGVIRTAYEYMQDYELWDVNSSPSKLPGSFMTYLSSYEMPFLYVSPTDSLSDLLTLCHEFGHFVDGFVNCGGFSGVDCAEVFSQGLEYLALGRADLNPGERRSLIRAKAADSVMVFLTQACYAEFEHLAYSLPEEKLTAQGLNELFMECSRKYGISALYMGMEDLLAPGWIDVQHFFIAPYYVISYCVSNDAALQLYERELEEGDGLEAYYDLLCLPTDSSILELLEEAGMESPFTPGRVEELTDFLDDQLD
ncbi:MAG: hypothetical protein J6K89_07530 [Oscillospiraceae bacterium]|nr:hypothetical protein [Oscillospiraceae bacterium]